MTTRTQEWHQVEVLPEKAVEIYAEGDEFSTVPGQRHYYILLSRGEYWLYGRIYNHATHGWTVYERELVPARPSDAHWIAAYPH